MNAIYDDSILSSHVDSMLDNGVKDSAIIENIANLGYTISRTTLIQYKTNYWKKENVVNIPIDTGSFISVERDIVNDVIDGLRNKDMELHPDKTHFAASEIVLYGIYEKLLNTIDKSLIANEKNKGFFPVEQIRALQVIYSILEKSRVYASLRANSVYDDMEKM